MYSKGYDLTRVISSWPSILYKLGMYEIKVYKILRVKTINFSWHGLFITSPSRYAFILSSNSYNLNKNKFCNIVVEGYNNTYVK